jgi:uncharacterized membrane protein
VVRFAAIGEAFELIRQDLGTYVLAVFLTGLLGYLSQLALQLPLQLLAIGPRGNIDEILFNPAFWVLWLLLILVPNTIYFVLGAGFSSMCMRRLRGQPVSIANLFDGFKHFFSLGAAGILTVLLKGSGFLLFIVPGIFAVGVLAFVPMVMMDQRCGALEGIRISYTALRRDWFMMAVLACVCYILAMAGMCLCLVGVIFTAPIYYFTLAIHYHAYFPPQGGPQPEPMMAPIVPQYSV